MEFKHILLPFDGSDHSANAAAYAAHMAKDNGAKITILHCYNLYPHLDDLPGEFIGKMEELMQKQAKVVIAEASAILEEAGVPYDTSIDKGAPGTVITELAKSKEFDLIIMGSGGHSEIGGMLRGSVTHKVISTVYCPVLIVP